MRALVRARQTGSGDAAMGSRCRWEGRVVKYRWEGRVALIQVGGREGGVNAGGREGGGI